MKETRLASDTHCLCCKMRIDAASSVDSDAKPEPGDITVCIYCGHLMAFGENLKLRELTNDEMKRTAGDIRILQIQRARAEIKRSN